MSIYKWLKIFFCDSRIFILSISTVLLTITGGFIILTGTAIENYRPASRLGEIAKTLIEIGSMLAKDFCVSESAAQGGLLISMGVVFGFSASFFILKKLRAEA